MREGRAEREPDGGGVGPFPRRRTGSALSLRMALFQEAERIDLWAELCRQRGVGGLERGERFM